MELLEWRELGRRAPRREDALIYVAQRGRASAAEIARACNIPPARVKWLMRGRPDLYRDDRSPMQMGFVSESREGRSLIYTITPRGRLVGASLQDLRLTKARVQLLRHGRVTGHTLDEQLAALATGVEEMPP